MKEYPLSRHWNHWDAVLKLPDECTTLISYMNIVHFINDNSAECYGDVYMLKVSKALSFFSVFARVQTIK